MRSRVLRLVVAMLGPLWGLTSALPAASLSCGSAGARSHACCCSGANTAVAGGCCAAAPAAPSTPTPRADRDEGCRCTIQAPAPPIDVAPVAPAPLRTPVALVTNAWIAPTAAAAVRIPPPPDASCHAPPSAAPRAPRGPPDSSCDSVA